uniref:NIF domain-containing protein n=1 Tax=Coccidioides posadasii RMSCC 3488 TaxID=454284 RepID=A0A0J6ETH2_COCPO|nr:NIF domain-containing protein [Coccidioides posadasii RMSCC 3488]
MILPRRACPFISRSHHAISAFASPTTIPPLLLCFPCQAKALPRGLGLRFCCSGSRASKSQTVVCQGNLKAQRIMPPRKPRRSNGRKAQPLQQNDGDAHLLADGSRWRPGIGCPSRCQNADSYSGRYDSYQPGERQRRTNGDSWRPEMTRYTPPSNRNTAGNRSASSSQTDPYLQPKMLPPTRYQPPPAQMNQTLLNLSTFPATPWMVTPPHPCPAYTLEADRNQHPPAIPSIPYPQFQFQYSFPPPMLPTAWPNSANMPHFAPLGHVNTPFPAIQPPTYTPSHNMSTSRQIAPPIAPIPTEEYLKNASLEPASTSSPRPLLIILDMNGTLIHRNRRTMPSVFVKRPGLDNFMKHVLDQHKVIIWTSSKPGTVREVMKWLFPSAMQSKFVTIWARDKLDLTPEQYNEKVQVYKKLDKIWADDFIQSRYPESNDGGNSPGGCVWDQSNTILIDDSKIKAAGQPYNIIEIPEFTNDASVDEKRNMKIVLRQLRVLSRQQDASRKLRQWAERREAADASLSETEFWETELRKDEQELGLEDDISIKRKGKKKKKAKLLTEKAPPTASVEEEIKETQSVLELQGNIADDTSQLEDEVSDVTEDDDQVISVPKDIVERDPAISTTPNVPAVFP